MIIQRKQSSGIQTNKTGGKPFSDTSTCISIKWQLQTISQDQISSQDPVNCRINFQLKTPLTNPNSSSLIFAEVAGLQTVFVQFIECDFYK